MFRYNITDWGWMTHICFTKLTIMSSDNAVTATSHKRHCFSNNRQHNSLFNNLPSLTARKHQNSPSQATGDRWIPTVTDVLTHRDPIKMVDILQMTFSNAFLWIKFLIFWMTFTKVCCNLPLAIIIFDNVLVPNCPKQWCPKPVMSSMTPYDVTSQQALNSIPKSPRFPYWFQGGDAAVTDLLMFN